MLSAKGFRGQTRIDIYAELEDGESGERFKFQIKNVQFTDGRPSQLAGRRSGQEGSPVRL